MTAQDPLDPPAINRMLLFIAERVIGAEAELSEADRHLGDGDHGLGMARGFAAVRATLEGEGIESIAKVFRTAGLTLLSTMGGASGALFGTLFRAGGKALQRCAVLDSLDYAGFLEAALDGVKARGRAKPGEKTMIDALEPAAIKARELVGQSLGDAASAVAAAARAGAEATTAMRATAGRAKALGDASIGYVDPGALSVAIILEAIRDFIQASQDQSCAKT